MFFKYYIDIMHEKLRDASIYTADDMSSSVKIIEFLKLLYPDIIEVVDSTTEEYVTCQ